MCLRFVLTHGVFSLIFVIMLKHFILISLFGIIAKAENKKCTNLEWSWINQGFHRDITYKVEILTNFKCSGCKILIKQAIPSSLFVNKDQLEDLKRLNKTNAFVNEFVDVELPEDVSETHDVLLFGNIIKTDRGSYSSEINLPIHLRYHLPQPGGGFRSSIFNLPDLYILQDDFPSECTVNEVVKFLCSSDSFDLCDFHQLSYEINDESLEVLIPVGNSEHYDAVILVTHLVTIAGAMYIYLVALLNLPKS